MKIIRQLSVLFLAAIASATVLVAKPIPGPKGGKIVTTEAPHVEFFVAPDHTVVVAFYDQDLKPVTPCGQLVSAVAEGKTGKVTLGFAPKENTLVSTRPLPEGEGYRVVLQVRDNAQARPKNYRVEFHDEICSSCKRAEYACICDESGEKH